jgi:hypothetical protein
MNQLVTARSIPIEKRMNGNPKDFLDHAVVVSNWKRVCASR